MAEGFENADQTVVEDEEDYDYYAILNCGREASQEELRAAYRRMCVLYHPDKHLDPEKKKIAVQLFSKVQTAYTVLSDEHTRVIYDLYGAKGLEAGLEIIERHKTPKEIQQEYEHLRMLKEEARLNQLSKPKGRYQVSLDVKRLFQSDKDKEEDEQYSSPVALRGFHMSQYIEIPLTTQITAKLNGLVNVAKGVGNGSMSVFLNKTFSHTAWVEFMLGFGNGLMFDFRGARSITSGSIGVAGATLVFQEQAPGLRFYSSCSRHLGHYTTGTLEIGLDDFLDSSMSGSLVRETDHSRFELSVSLSLESTVAASCSYQVTEDTWIHTVAKAGMFGYVVNYGVKKRVSEYTLLKASILFGVPTGVICNFKIFRGSQTYNFPIFLSNEIIPSALFYATVFPVAAYLTVKKLIIDPFTKKEKERDLEKQKEQLEKQMTERRKEAQDHIHLMEESYKRNVEFEKARHGLVIVKALYGTLVSQGEDTERDAGVLDVTVPLQCEVRDSRLVIPAGPKWKMNGFYDVSINKEKLLKIRYIFRDMMHEATFSDEESVKIPKQSHCLLR